MKYLLFLILSMSILISCTSEEEFRDIDCVNNAEVVDGVCRCIDGFHAEFGSCSSNTKNINCKDNAPDNAKSDIKEEEITWNKSTSSWNSATDCNWSCKSGYKLNDEKTACIVDDLCLVKTCPTHSTCLVENNEAICSCDTEFHTEDNLISCISNTKEVDCNSITPPQYATLKIEKVNITWNESTSSWSTPSDCSWSCIDNYEVNINNDGCNYVCDNGYEVNSTNDGCNYICSAGYEVNTNNDGCNYICSGNYEVNSTNDGCNYICDINNHFIVNGSNNGCICEMDYTLNNDNCIYVCDTNNHEVVNSTNDGCDCEEYYYLNNGVCKSAIVINEINMENDWVEVYNNSSSDLDISNWKFNDTYNPYLKNVILPIDTTIPAYGYYSFDFDFDIGYTHTLRLSTNGTVMDSTTFSDTGITSSYARIENGIGNFKNNRVATKDKENLDLEPKMVSCDTDYTYISSDITAQTPFEVYNFMYSFYYEDNYPQIIAKVCWKKGTETHCSDEDDSNGTDSLGNNPTYYSSPTGNQDKYIAELRLDAGSYDIYFKFSGDMGNSWTEECNITSVTILDAPLTEGFNDNTSQYDGCNDGIDNEDPNNGTEADCSDPNCYKAPNCNSCNMEGYRIKFGNKSYMIRTDQRIYSGRTLHVSRGYNGRNLNYWNDCWGIDMYDGAPLATQEGGEFGINIVVNGGEEYQLYDRYNRVLGTQTVESIANKSKELSATDVNQSLEENYSINDYFNSTPRGYDIDKAKLTDKVIITEFSGNPTTDCQFIELYCDKRFETDCSNLDEEGYPIDDDGDGLANCADSDCKGTPACVCELNGYKIVGTNTQTNNEVFSYNIAPVTIENGKGLIIGRNETEENFKTGWNLTWNYSDKYQNSEDVIKVEESISYKLINSNNEESCTTDGSCFTPSMTTSQKSIFYDLDIEEYMVDDYTTDPFSEFYSSMIHQGKEIIGRISKQEDGKSDSLQYIKIYCDIGSNY